MKDAPHHLKQVQRKMIQKARREERMKLNQISGMTVEDEKEEMPLKDMEHEKQEPRMHVRPNYH